MNAKKPTLIQTISADTWGFIAWFGVVLGFAMIISKEVFGIDLFGKERAYDDPVDKLKEDHSTIIIGALAIALCVPLGIYRYRRTRAILVKGVETPFTITSTGVIKKSGMKDITIEYGIDGKTYKKKLTVSSEWTAEDFRLIVNPDKPNHLLTEGITKDN